MTAKWHEAANAFLALCPLPAKADALHPRQLLVNRSKPA